MSSNAGNSNNVLNANSDGNLNNNNYSYHRIGVRPVVYLSSDVQIDTGTGTELDPYKLK